MGSRRYGSIRVAAATPMRVDFLSDEHHDGKKLVVKVMPAIFRFDGERLVVAYGDWCDEGEQKVGGDYAKRAKAFTSTKANRVGVSVYKPGGLYDAD